MRLMIICLLLSSCTYHHTVEIDKVKPVEVYDYHPQLLSYEEQLSFDAVYMIIDGVRVQKKPGRMFYPYIDGSSRECRRLTEDQLQIKRQNPEISITCVNGMAYLPDTTER